MAPEAAEGAGAPCFDAAIIGGGPAGLSAASWLGRYRRSVVVIDSEEYRNACVEMSHGYLGTDPAPPAELRRRARQEVARYPTVTFAKLRVDRASGIRDRFLLSAGNETLRARRILLATGVSDEYPEVKGFFEHYGASVFHCTSCDGYEAKDCDIVVFGWGNQVTGFALSLLTWAASVSVVTEGRHLEADHADRDLLAARGVTVIEDDGVELVGQRGGLEGVRLASGATVSCQLAFFSIAHRPNNRLATELGCTLTEGDCVDVDGDGLTSVPGVYAAGDLTPGVQLIANAVAKGAVAGIACAQSLLGDKP
ncbi:MAG: NAD(P)/FAD-dependent oxidoreductase [Actinobacteria bacterium]|nr:NAD(P)/FAD-dependent oxidoreductase [Actinomycetota bacterium]